MSAGAALAADFRERIDRYREARDFPAARGPSYLSVHLRFGTVSIRELVAYAHLRSLEPDGDGAATWLSELDLARVLRADPLAPPARRRARVQAAVRRAALSRRPGAVRRMARGTHRLPHRRRRDAADQRVGLHAQPAADDRGLLPRQGPARGLAPGRKIFRRHAARLRPRVEQRRLAMGGLHGLRRATVLPHLQSGDAVGALRSRGQVHPALRAGTGAARREGDPRAMARRARDPAGKGRGDRPGLSGADRRSRRRAPRRAGALRGGAAA